MLSSEHSLGPYLRSIREEQGIDVKDVVSSTKIQPKFIEALESDDYGQLPKGPFVIGFLRSYAQCLSLDADEVIAFFQASQGRRRPGAPAVRRQSRAPVPRPSWHRRAILGGGVAGLVVLVVILVFALRSGPAKLSTAHDRPAVTTANETLVDQPTVPAPVDVPTPPIPRETTASHATPALPLPPVSKPAEPEPVAEAPAAAEAAPPEASARVVDEGTALQPTPLILRVQALEETWMRVEIDDTSRQDTLIKAGESAEWKASTQFSLTLGNVQGARVLLNDREIELPKTRSNVLRDYVLTRALLNPRRTD